MSVPYPDALVESLRQAMVVAVEETGHPAEGQIVIVKNEQLGETVIELTPVD
jgi:hypothetical protein